MKTTAIALFLCFLLSSCTKHDPNPELQDEIYKDLSTELEIATKTYESEEKNLAGVKAELEKAVPQTGQIKYATKKVQDAEDALSQANQRKIFFDIKRERRKAYVQFRYEESLRKGGRPWPDQKEIEEYKAVEQFNREKLAWDRTKGMRKEVPRGTKSGPATKGGAKSEHEGAEGGGE